MINRTVFYRPREAFALHGGFEFNENPLNTSWEDIQKRRVAAPTLQTGTRDINPFLTTVLGYAAEQIDKALNPLGLRPRSLNKHSFDLPFNRSIWTPVQDKSASLCAVPFKPNARRSYQLKSIGQQTPFRMDTDELNRRVALIREKNTRSDFLSKAADNISEFMVTNPIARGYGLIYQGVADAGMNPLGYVARGYGLDTRPLEPRNFTERALETIPRIAYNGAMSKFWFNVFNPALSYGGANLSRLWNAPRFYGKVNKIAQAALNPTWKELGAQSLATGGMEALLNPQSELGKYGADILGLALMNINNPVGLVTAPFKKGFKNAAANALRQSPLEALKKVAQNPKVQDFAEDVLIGEGVKRYVGNLLDPRYPSSPADAVASGTLKEKADTKSGYISYNPYLDPPPIMKSFSNTGQNTMPFDTPFKYSNPLQPFIYNRPINGGVNR